MHDGGDSIVLHRKKSVIIVDFLSYKRTVGKYTLHERNSFRLYRPKAALTHNSKSYLCTRKWQEYSKQEPIFS